MKEEKIIFITGCSSGIGAALAEEFHRQGHKVYATGRHIESMSELSHNGIRTLVLDVTNSDHIDHAIKTVQDEVGHIDILINNAGFLQVGPLIECEQNEMRCQFDTNVFAPIALSRAAFPLLQKSADARIVNIGSISGILTTPFIGVYCASKAALQALTEVLRMELAPFGIRVLHVQTGFIASNLRKPEAIKLCRDSHSLYKPIETYAKTVMTNGERGAMPTKIFAKKLVDLLLQSNPPSNIPLGPKSRFLKFVKRLLPTRLLDRLLSKGIGLDQLKKKR